jgi:uncharacterized membrane protein YdjX (TVP38/TMEM64 family)
MSESGPARTARGWLRWLPILLIGVLFVALIASGALQRLSLSGLAAHHAQLTAFVARHPLASLAAYFGVYVLVIVACAPGPAVMSVAGGFLFGPFLGGVATLASCLVGGVIVFAACRTAFGDWAAHRAGATVARIEAGFSRDAFAYLLALRLMPVAPFALVTLAAGLARVRPAAFILATLIGGAPSAFVLAGLGSGLDGVLRRGGKVDASLFARPDIALPLAGLAILALAAPAWRLWRVHRLRARA